LRADGVPAVRGRLLATLAGFVAPAAFVVLGLAVGAAAMPRSAWAQGADLRAIVARARPSVLPVGTYSPTDSPRFGFRGSGFVVGDGTLVVTNVHVLPASASAGAATQAEAAVSGTRLAVLARSAAPGREAGDMRLAQIVALDREHDIALLRIEGAALPPLPLDGAERAGEGKAVALLGFPIGGALGYSTVVHRGIVASVTTVALPAPTAAQLDPRAVSRLRAGNFEVLQLDATAYPGNSGGPVLDADSGEVLGIVDMVLVRGSRETALSAPTGISYAIPVSYLRSLLEEQGATPAPRR
jgi:serine protease Do